MTDKHRLELDGYKALLDDYCRLSARVEVLEVHVEALSVQVAALTTQLADMRAVVSGLTTDAYPLSRAMAQWVEVRLDGNVTEYVIQPTGEILHDARGLSPAKFSFRTYLRDLTPDKTLRDRERIDSLLDSEASDDND